MTKIREG